MHVDMWWIGPMWPKCGDQKGIIWKNDMPFGNPPHHATKNCGGFKKFESGLFLASDWSKSVFLGQKTVFWVFWTECEAADLKQRQKIFRMNHRNKITMVDITHR